MKKMKGYIYKCNACALHKDSKGELIYDIERTKDNKTIVYYNNEKRIIEGLSFVFHSEKKLTKSEALDTIKGTKGFGVKGKFKKEYLKKLKKFFMIK